MEWTREQRYLPYDQHSAEELMHLQAQAAQSPYQLHYHIRPMSGLLNDPNGFSYFNDQWHVFYQSFPFGASHGLKSWRHMVSDDLVHWRELGVALEPDTEYDSHGAYSGSAREFDGKLFLMYTGNHRDENWVRTPYQLGAWMDTDGHVEKLKEPLFVNPDNITEHFRDPQIMKQNGKYYALLGAQTEDEPGNKQGHLDLWRSDKLESGWEEVGFVNFTKHEMGYMIECPNLVFVDGKPVIIFCPQGLDKKVADYDNIYPNMYMMGDDFDFDQPALVNSSQTPRNLDDGFDVYATQAFNGPDGKVYTMSWVGLPDSTYPTDDENWASCMSQVKELHVKDGKLYQTPVPAMKELRNAKNTCMVGNQTKQIIAHAGQQYELNLTIEAGQSGTLHLQANEDTSSSIQVRFDTEKGQLTVDRGHAGLPVNEDHGTTRTIKLPKGKELELDIFIDHSLAEIFVNGGEHVITLRYFNDQSFDQVTFDEPTNATGTLWQLDAM